jgi:ATP-binding cassette subfamily G (WHITE) protein 2 (PDR)
VLTNYFEKNGSRSCGVEENPAEWMLEVIGAAPGSANTIDWSQTWHDSPERQAVKQHLAELKEKLSQTIEIDEEPNNLKEFAAPLSLQFTMNLERVFQQYWRTPSYLYSKTVLCAGSVILSIHSH